MQLHCEAGFCHFGDFLVTYIAMLRGVNVGGKTMAMSELRELCSSLKLKDAQTYIQSGNVVLGYDGVPSQLEDILENGIKKRFGMDVKVVVRAASDLSEIISSNPFGEGAYVTFLSSKPEKVDLDAINRARAMKEDFKIVEREVYLLLPNGYGRSKLNNNFFEAKLGVAATTRNLKTARALLAMAKSSEPAQH